jgi:uncharacterized protein
MRFDWDRTKAEQNRKKHRVPFEEACTAFADLSVLTIHDDEHLESEDRWASLRMSVMSRILVVIHTAPEPDESGDERVRIISARRVNKREQAVYLERRR